MDPSTWGLEKLNKQANPVACFEFCKGKIFFIVNQNSANVSERASQYILITARWNVGWIIVPFDGSFTKEEKLLAIRRVKRKPDLYVMIHNLLHDLLHLLLSGSPSSTHADDAILNQATLILSCLHLLLPLSGILFTQLFE